MHKLPFLLVMLCAFAAEAQVTELSPYSRFGLGDPSPAGYPSQFAMGGSGVAHTDFLHLNPLNPATMAFLTTPAFEFGVNTEQLTTSSSDLTATNSTTRFNHFAVGFPMWNGKWGAAFGLDPYTQIGYNNTETIYDPLLDVEYQSVYTGSGGLNRAYLDIGRRLLVIKDTSEYKLNSFLSLGAEGSYLFGTSISERSSLFPGNQGFISTRIEDVTTVSDFTFKGGLLFRHFIDKRSDSLKVTIIPARDSIPEMRIERPDRTYIALNLGLTLETGGNLNAKRSRDIRSYVSNASGIEITRDSISSFDGLSGSIDLPSTIHSGLSMEIYRQRGQPDRKEEWRKFMVNLDFRVTDWSNTGERFRQEVTYDGLGLQSQVMLGIGYRPSSSTKSGDEWKAFKLATYRAGFRTGSSHLEINGEVLNETGMSFGLNLPLTIAGVNKSDTTLDLAVEYGQRGTTDLGLIQEDFYRIMVGVSFHPVLRYDRWFAKRKYD